jgi:hypothetical protein
VLGLQHNELGEAETRHLVESPYLSHELILRWRGNRIGKTGRALGKRFGRVDRFF